MRVAAPAAALGAAALARHDQAEEEKDDWEVARALNGGVWGDGSTSSSGGDM